MKRTNYDVCEVNHPLIKHHLARLRDKNSPPWEFRQQLQRLATLLAYEATRDLGLRSVQVATPNGPAECQILGQRVAFVPILRAGLGMIDPILELIPTAEVWHLGLYRDEETALPIEYYSKLPSANPPDIAMVLDPMLATGGSINAAIAALKTWGASDIRVLSIISAQPGIETVLGAHPDVRIYTCVIDPILDDRRFIVPGLGDAGDRTFNTLPPNS
jgi:uracil phosphoribosyltransferase